MGFQRPENSLKNLHMVNLFIFQKFDEKYGVQTEYNKDLYSKN